MATTAPHPDESVHEEPLSAPGQTGSGTLRLSAIQPLSAPPAARRRSPWASRLLVLALVLGGLGAAAWGLSGQIKGWIAGDGDTYYLTRQVHRGDLLVTVTEDGNVESVSNTEVRCQVAGGSSILWIIPDGSYVKKGDEIVRLNSAPIEDLVNQQKILYEKAQATRIEAEKLYSAAKIAVQEYLEGTYVKELQLIDASITIALENLRSSENSLQHTERMARKGYVTPLQLDAQRFAVERAKLDLATAQTSKTALEKFTKVKMMEDLESARDSAEARMRSEQASCELEHTRLERLLTQLDQCKIVAPADGMVIYANEFSSGRGSSTIKIEEGAAVRERQAIIRMPDLAQMQVKVIVHESKVDSLAPGMRARINIQDRDFQGEVITVANQPEPTSFFTASVKEYGAIVRIDGRTTGLKPGMTAEVEILVSDQKNVLSIPTQAVVETDGGFCCWVLDRGAPSKRHVVLGNSNNTSIEIKDGLLDGDDVILNPRATVADARREDHGNREKVDVAKRFGSRAKGAKSPVAMAGKPSGQPGGAKAPAGRTAAGGPPAMQSLDRDGDGKISRDEAPAPMQPYFDKIDTNHDGFLSSEEMAAARARRQQQPAAAPPLQQPTLGGAAG